MSKNGIIKIVLLHFICILLSKQAESNATNYMTKNRLQDLYIECIAQDSVGFIWVGSKSGIARFESGSFIPGRVEAYSEHNSRIISRRIYAIHLDRKKASVGQSRTETH